MPIGGNVKNNSAGGFYRWSMVRNGVPVVLVLISLLSLSYAQKADSWQNGNCAVVLTYDDALNVHLDNVVPLLDSLGLKGTFFLSGFSPAFKERVNDWRTVARHGHELGNHTLFHPCEGKLPGREWVQSDYDLSSYTLGRMVDEIRMANVVLEAIDGKKKRTFAYPCGDMEAGGASYVDTIRKDFPGARGVEGKLQNIDEIDLYNIGSYMINGQSGDELITLVKNAKDKNALLVFLFHGVGGEHSLTVSLGAHRTLLYYLAQHEKDIWVAPLVDVVEYIRSTR
jgi:peptidoglycan-N-acetylglucosamine deacetylase